MKRKSNHVFGFSHIADQEAVILAQVVHEETNDVAATLNTMQLLDDIFSIQKMGRFLNRKSPRVKRLIEVRIQQAIEEEKAPG